MKTQKFKFVYAKSAAMAVLGMVVLSGFQAKASLITIQNSGFEAPVINPSDIFNNPGPIAGWSISGSGSTSGYEGYVGVENFSQYSAPGFTAQEGQQFGYINSSASGTTSISQVLSATLQANTRYDLSIFVAGRKDGYIPGLTYSISLFAGSTFLTSVTPIIPVGGVWTDLLGSYTSGSSVIGDPLKIVIANGPSANINGLYFDNVSLNASAVPEASTIIAGALLLLPFGAGAIRAMRKNVTA